MKCEKANKVDLTNAADYFSFEQQNNYQSNKADHEIRQPFHMHENSWIAAKNAAETATQIIAANSPVSNPALCRYLNEKRISKSLADVYWYEVNFKIENNDELLTAIGFKNNAGGCELRNDFLCLDSSPTFIAYIVNSRTKTYAQKLPVKSILDDQIVAQNDTKKTERSNAISDENCTPNKESKNKKLVAVSDDFFHFLTFPAIQQNQKQSLTNFLILNTLHLFERSLLLSQKYKQVQLYLRHNDGSKKHIHCTSKRPVRFIIQSILYKDYEGLHNWLLHFGSLQRTGDLKESEGMRLP